ncbi:hypothetical protein PHMEG_00015976 [Phytophthora megakarya]|uniref:Uncharacterized protein n=1 Tax=Phytophthora megakarya TaxID=4795 RepID=A0A225W220_9STRA|nr:hypothetical protein PHMEG_00015976 [Phytophthora megakarya]
MDCTAIFHSQVRFLSRVWRGLYKNRTPYEVCVHDMQELWEMRSRLEGLTFSAHSRGAVPCTLEAKPRVTKDMKKFFVEQDDIGVPPRSILANVKKQSHVQVTEGGWPKLLQIQNSSKNI